MLTPYSTQIRQQHKSTSSGVSLYSDQLTLSPELLKALSSLDTITESPSIKIYKKETRKSVLHLTLAPNLGGSFVIKGYPFKRIQNQIRPARFGPLEASTQLNAQQLGINTPSYLDYFKFKKFGLTKSNGVIIEELKGKKLSWKLHSLTHRWQPKPSSSQFLSSLSFTKKA